MAKQFVVTRNALHWGATGVIEDVEVREYARLGSAMRAMNEMNRRAKADMKRGYMLLPGDPEEYFAGQAQTVTMTEEGQVIAFVEYDDKGKLEDARVHGKLDVKSIYPKW